MLHGYSYRGQCAQPERTNIAISNHLFHPSRIDVPPVSCAGHAHPCRTREVPRHHRDLDPRSLFPGIAPRYAPVRRAAGSVKKGSTLRPPEHDWPITVVPTQPMSTHAAPTRVAEKGRLIGGGPASTLLPGDEPILCDYGYTLSGGTLEPRVGRRILHGSAQPLTRAG